MADILANAPPQFHGLMVGEYWPYCPSRGFYGLAVHKGGVVVGYVIRGPRAPERSKPNGNPQEAALNIDEQLYERLIKPIEDRMIRSIWRILRDPDDADDALQDALATIWKRLDRVRKHPNPQALVLKICADAAYDALRRRIRSSRREDWRGIDENRPDSAPLVSEELSRRDRRREIFGAIARLPRNQATAVLMRFVQEQPYSVVAKALGCTEGTARTHVKRARERLRTLLARGPHDRTQEAIR